MSTPHQYLLRRTTAAIAAATGFVVVADGHAQSTVTLQGSTGPSCAYSGLSVAPNGNVVVQCAATNPASPGSFALFPSAITVAPGASAALSVTRSGGTSGAATVTYTPSGAGCAGGSGSVTFGDGDAGNKAISIAAGASGTCTVSLSTSNGTVGGGAVISVQSATPPPTGGGECPAGFTPPVNLQSRNFGNAGDKLEIMASSGQITSIPLPKVPLTSGRNTGYLNMLDSPALYTPPSSVLEISINKCPGLMDTNTSNSCNTSFRDVGYVSYYWFARTTARFSSAQIINSARACYAPESEGQWYLNARWTFSNCSFGATTCGFKFYWSPGAY